MWTKVNKTIALDQAMLDEIETRMKDDGVSMAELVRRAISLYLTIGNKTDSEDKSNLSDMLNDSEYS